MTFGRCGAWPSKIYCFKATSLTPAGNRNLPAKTQRRKHASAIARLRDRLASHAIHRNQP